ncbi:MAG: hypothetical protein ACRERV_07885 [Methylococcales bacterium]
MPYLFPIGGGPPGGDEQPTIVFGISFYEVAERIAKLKKGDAPVSNQQSRQQPNDYEDGISF